MPRTDEFLFDDFQQRTIAGPLFEANPFEDSPSKPSPDELLLGSFIWKQKGRANPISIARLRELTSFSERQIKGIVEQLVVTHKLKIGARREEPVGYFMIVDATDQETAVRTFRNQIIAMWRRLRVIDDRRSLREFHGQLTLDEE